MKIGIDISQIVYQGTGVASYTESLVRSLAKIDNSDEFVLFGSSLRNKRLLKQFIKTLDQENFKHKFSSIPPKLLELLWNGIHVLPIENFIGDIDVFHSSDWLEPPTRNAKRVTTIHDFSVYKYPETFFSRGGHDIVKNQKRKLFFVKQYSDMVIAVSETTKKDAMEILNIPEKKIKVIYEAADSIFYPIELKKIEETKEKFGIRGNYLFCVGTREPRKNLTRVVEAFEELSSANQGLELVIVGKYGWGVEDLDSRDKKFKDKLKVLGRIEKEDLAVLYSGASVFVYPSLYEGFGLPIIEAMSCGCPVITSDRGSMKEIAGNAAMLVDPESVKEITNAISRVYRNEQIKKELSTKGLKRAGEFSWDKNALQTLEIYRSFL